VSPEISAFLEETPPNLTEVSTGVLDMIKQAKKSIRIIQPYVSNVEEFEDLIVEAMEKRGVEVEIITARIRD
jgi:phosphatidylserine/phosphatidylglycerophosphate/cardiolipin synthase-like enzyme